ncbi:UDP-N-acetylglucosamine 2-epimerase (non-hydrolyzing) [Candidatus Woesearchaeota archaeon]|nr:MAG: UDP-N-acetylglucosamine 2-epimerase (non-hydrolyzing) [Candidatus Woesearchaeota archaeon]
MKIVSVVGARPQFIKASAVSGELRKKHTEILIHTGQHFDDNMSAVFFEELGIPKPDINLHVSGGTNTGQVARMMLKLEKQFRELEPELVLVYGDTNSTLAGALTGRQMNIPVAHVEAGLRSFRMSMPEEQNRIITDAISSILFCPTMTAVEQLRKEGIERGVYFTGDVMYDAVLRFKDMSSGRVDYGELGVKPGQYNLLTLHRAENTDNKENLRGILRGVRNSSIPVVFPMHPRTKKALKKHGLENEISGNIHVIEPVGYLEMIELEKNAKRILTDSGGVQKEAYFLKVPCITLREETEWVETVEDGWNVLTGADENRISREINSFSPAGKQRNVFGDGKAGSRIVEILSEVEG